MTDTDDVQEHLESTDASLDSVRHWYCVDCYPTVVLGDVVTSACGMRMREGKTGGPDCPMCWEVTKAPCPKDHA